MALIAVVAFLVSQFAWQALQVDQQFAGWTAGMGLYVALQSLLVANAYRSWPMLAASALGGVCGFLTFACSARWLIAPWIPTGRGRCSAAFDFPVGALAATLALVLVWRIHERGRHGRHDLNGGQ